MSLIIDGYNVLHISRFAPTSNNDEFQTLRNQLLRYLAERIDSRQHKYVFIVFDSEQKRPGDDTEYSFRHLRVFFARNHVTADDMIIEMIRADTVARQLTVVSSDHRIQVAARRKRASFVDSDDWYDRLPERPVHSDSHSAPELTTEEKSEPSNFEELFDIDELNEFERRLRRKDGRS